MELIQGEGVMVTCLCEQEGRFLDSLSRPQLLDAIEEHRHCLPADLQERIGEQSTGRLRLFVLVGRLIHALRQQPRGRFRDQPSIVLREENS
jgi:hypothetical protein